MYKTVAEAKQIMKEIEVASKYYKVDIHKILFNTCDEITDEIIVNA